MTALHYRFHAHRFSGLPARLATGTGGDSPTTRDWNDRIRSKADPDAKNTTKARSQAQAQASRQPVFQVCFKDQGDIIVIQVADRSVAPPLAVCLFIYLSMYYPLNEMDDGDGDALPLAFDTLPHAL